MLSSFYNTTNETGQLLIEYTSKTIAQDRAVLTWFRKEKEAIDAQRALQRYNVDRILNNALPEMDLVGFRRSCTTLSKKGFMEMSATANVMGVRGRKVHTYKAIR